MRDIKYKIKRLFEITGLVLLLSVTSHSWGEVKNNKQRTQSSEQTTNPSTKLRTNNEQQAMEKGPKFLSDDPVWIDLDRLSIPKPTKIELSKGYDFIENTFDQQGGDLNQKAQNINTLGEVPDSSWFTNRIGLHPMTVEQLARGPNKGNGPDMSNPWTITSAKIQGITPGFVIKDSRGDTYFLKFDPLKYSQLATSTEVISTKFFYAFGYNVPENYLAFVRPDQLKIGPKAEVIARSGKKRKMTQKDIDDLLTRIPKRPDGTIQVLASLRIPGEPVGRFRYYGIRSDDPNDIFPHENRRELRGLRVFFSWLNHNDSDAVNTLDMFTTEGDNSYVKHYLIDFGTTCGSGAIAPHGYREGNEYYYEPGLSAKTLITLGIWDRPWNYVKYPDYPAIGRFESSFFQPERWKPDYPNPAHDRMKSEDAFWATRTVSKFTDEMIRAIVRTGQISDPNAENYLIKTLIERRDKIIRYYFSQLNPLDDFQLRNSNTLNFRNLGAEMGLGKVDFYQYQWFRFNNEQRSLEPIGGVQSLSSPSLPLPQDASPYVMVWIQTLDPNQPNWKKSVDIYIRSGSTNKSIVGIEREN
jgi:hypothetical protein